MKGEHSNVCLKGKPDCLCNRCKHDNRYERGWCCFENKSCPIDDCPDYERDDEEEGASDAREPY